MLFNDLLLYCRTCYYVEKTMECVVKNTRACTPTDMIMIREDLGIVGNISAMYCPGVGKHFCQLKEFQGVEVGQSCATGQLETCANSFFDQTYNKTLTEQQFCGYVMLYDTVYILSSVLHLLKMSTNFFRREL